MKAEILDDFLKNCKTRGDVFGENGVMKQIVKALTERVLQAELTSHLGYEKHEPKGKNSGNSRNGTIQEMEMAFTEGGRLEESITEMISLISSSVLSTILGSSFP